LTRDLSFSERICLSAAVDLADANGALRSTSIAEIGAHAAINPKIVRRALREAASAGLLSIEPRASFEARSPKLSLPIMFAAPEICAALWLHREAA